MDTKRGRKKLITRPITIGIVGGGQLGKMMTIAAKKMGLDVVVIDPTPHSPAGQVADRQIIGGYKDEKATRELAEISDVITVDAEFVNETVLKDLEKKGKHIHPSPRTIEIIKDKLKQKKFLKKNNIPTAQFAEIRNEKDIVNATRKFEYPFLLKARMDAYDGKGNVIINNKNYVKKGLDILKDRLLYVEKYISFEKELAVMVARNTKGEIKVYPIVETIHVDNVCDTVIVPARISRKIEKKVTTLAKKTMKVFKGAGVFGIEMFLEKNGKILINEIAPRVHNSGHYTVEATRTSQFEQHIRAICGLPLGDTSLIVKAAVMKNILGEKNGSGIPKGMEKALRIPEASIHMYGKLESRPKRKMGHITVTGTTIEECLKKANQARRALLI